MKRLILGVEVDEADLAKLLEGDYPQNKSFNNNYFRDQLTQLEKTIEALSKAGSNFASDYIQLKRLFNGLSRVEEWFSKYNYNDEYPLDKVVKETRLVQVKAYIPGIKSMDKQHYAKVDGTGIFAPIDIYVIPFKLIEGTFDTPLDCLRHVSLNTGTSAYGKERNPYNLPLDAQYGSARGLSNTHFAVICLDYSNPIAPYLYRNISWRYIASDGSSL